MRLTLGGDKEVLCKLELHGGVVASLGVLSVEFECLWFDITKSREFLRIKTFMSGKKPA
jgi:hypothetical protein